LVELDSDLVLEFVEFGQRAFKLRRHAL
jgi:hypothetical protein